MSASQSFSPLFRGLLFGGMLVAGLLLEWRRPLRRVSQPKARRVVVNLGIAATAAVLLRLVFYPVVFEVSRYAARKNLGVLPWLGFQPFAEIVVAVLALDYTLYFWHWMNHRIPFLWRFHNAHHVDLDLDISTASRFHFGELVLSTVFRAGQILVLGIDPYTLILFETAVTTAAQFHHSNFVIPIRFERLLNRFLVTPRMHGIHHSIVRGETNSNYSTIFSFWDRLHRSIRLSIPQAEITIGVAPYRDPGELGLVCTLLLPFRKQRPWTLPDGTVPDRSAAPQGMRAERLL